MYVIYRLFLWSEYGSLALIIDTEDTSDSRYYFIGTEL